MRSGTPRRAAAGLFLLTVLLAACGGTTATTGPGAASGPPAPSATSASPTPAPTATAPSQSAADARRDGVVPALAALPFAVRVHVLLAVPAAEGVWALSRPTPAADRYADGCRLGPDTGKYATETVCTTEYGELLLLDAARTRILRAYPLPAAPPSLLVLTPDAVYCAREGDSVQIEGTLPDSMVCRVDRRTLAATVRIYPQPGDSVIVQPCFYPPAAWTVATEFLPVRRLVADGRGLFAQDAAGTWTRLDPATLAVLARGQALPAS